MKAFTLHDGEDDDKTEELHKIMAEKVLDWEGDNSGITVWIAVAAGDTMLFGDDGSFRVLSKKLPVTITKHAFRYVFAAMLLVEHDNGAPHVNRIFGPGTVDLSIFTMPYEYGVEKLAAADDALAVLSNESSVEFEDLVIGDEEDQLAIVRKYSEKNPGLAVAHQLINDWFNAWDGKTTDAPGVAP